MNFWAGFGYGALGAAVALGFTAFGAVIATKNEKRLRKVYSDGMEHGVDLRNWKNGVPPSPRYMERSRTRRK